MEGEGDGIYIHNVYLREMIGRGKSDIIAHVHKCVWNDTIENLTTNNQYPIRINLRNAFINVEKVQQREGREQY